MTLYDFLEYFKADIITRVCDGDRTIFTGDVCSLMEPGNENIVYEYEVVTASVIQNQLHIEVKHI
jgi:hypothetical protein